MVSFLFSREIKNFFLSKLSRQLRIYRMAWRMPEHVRFSLTVFFMCISWYSISSTSGIINKIFLQSYPYPMTVSLVSLISVPICSIPLTRLWRINRQTLPKGYLLKFVFPIALGKAIAVASAYFSLWKVPVSYAHTVKATMPLFAVFCARVVLGESQTTKVYLSLLPIILGVCIASLTELSFNFAGLFSALTSTFTYAMLSSLVKRVLKDTDMHPLKLLALNSQIAAMLFLPVWCYYDASTLWGEFTSPVQDKEWMHMLWLLFLSGSLSFAQNLCAFTLIHKLTALSYAVSSATKRIVVICASLLALHNPVTPMNMFGMFLAIFGVFLYNRACQSQKEQRHQLPMSRTHATLSDATLVALDSRKKYVDDEAGQLLSPASNDGVATFAAEGALVDRGPKAKFVLGNSAMKHSEENAVGRRSVRFGDLVQL
uniref:Sugar phosphate transporter domain-containing protein n=1 Tax=Plectus sambesii TaxID=2011161 RepID=A0A914W4C9_9BILA